MLHDVLTEQKQAFCCKLFAWFDCHKRSLPWRNSYAPYEVWISEVMLQQTQMERGVVYFQRWMEHFPTIKSVALASEEEILRHWEGLGYYKRAYLLHQSAKTIDKQYAGKLPSSYDELIKLPGIGAYTAAAILSIAYEQDIALIDANVERVFSRLLDIDGDIKKGPVHALLSSNVQNLLPRGKARTYNQALMELGALICKKNPLCGQCPLFSWCLARKNGTVLQRPVRSASKSKKDVIAVHAVAMRGHCVLMRQRPLNGLWAGLWEFPGTICSQSDPLRTLAVFLQKSGIRTIKADFFDKITHNYTNHHVTAYFFYIEIDADPLPLHAMASMGFKFMRCDELTNYAMPSHHRKIAQALQRCTIIHHHT